MHLQQDYTDLLQAGIELSQECTYMVASSLPKAIAIRESKIVHKSPIPHPMSRFVTEEAVCMMYRIGFADIYKIECWRYVVYIHAKGISQFVSYADFPPIVGVRPPNRSEFVKWRKRWRKCNDYAKRKQAPDWWMEFFNNEFSLAPSKDILHSWDKLLSLIKFAFTEETLQQLRNRYRLHKGLLST